MDPLATTQSSWKSLSSGDCGVQSSMSRLSSASVSATAFLRLSPERLSSRTRLLKLSTNGFSHGLPGSMNAAPVRENLHQPLSALEVISGTVVAANELWPATLLSDDPLKHVNHAVAVDPPLGLHRQASRVNSSTT
jgi:hypothetical protein